MARISGVDIPRDKRVDISLRYIYGIGATGARNIVSQAQVNPTTKVRDLTDEEVITYANDTPLAFSQFGAATFYGFVDRPRSVAVQASYRFGD